jgi:hypothetical protein
MMSLRTLALSSVLLVACTQDAPPPTKPTAEAAPTKAAPTKADKRLPVDDPHALPPPGQDEPPPPITASAKGSFEATIDGKTAHFVRLPPGQNRAVASAETGVKRVSLAASETEEGLPHLRMLIDGVRPDQLKYPLTITGKASGTTVEGPSLTVRYEVNDKRIYVIDPAKDANIEMTLEGFEGSTLRGRFKGKLAPTAAGLGAPIPIAGEFAVELGLQGVQPGPAPADAPADAKADAKVP